MRTLLLVLVAAAPGCCAIDLADCAPQSAEVPDPSLSCDDRWVCRNGIFPDDVYEVRCTDDASGARSCRCFHNGVPGKENPAGPWCGTYSPDAFERIIDANDACGWAMSTCRV